MTRPRLVTPDRLEALNALATPVWVFDVARHRLWWGNPAAIEFWQAGTLAELVGRDFSSDSAAVRVRLRQIIDSWHGNGPVHDTWTLYPRDRPRTVTLSMQPVLIEDGRDALMLEVVRFVDMQSEADALRMLEVVRASTLMLSSYTLDGRLLAQNPQALAAHGFGDDLPDALAIRLGDRRVAADLIDAVAADRMFVRELPILTRQGPRTHRVTARRGRDPVTAAPVIVLSEEDLTDQVDRRAQLLTLNDRLEAEVAARTAEVQATSQRLEHVIDGAKVPTWELDLRTGTLQVNAHWLGLAGLPPDAPRTLSDGWQTRLHPEDYAAMRAQLAAAGPQAQMVEARCRMRHEAGHWVHLITRRHIAERDADGTPVRLAGIDIDITPLVEAQDRISQAEARAQMAHDQLRDAVEALQDGFALYDAEDRLVLVNRRYRELYAISAPAILPGARFEDILRYGARHGQYPDAVGAEEAWLRDRLAQRVRGGPFVQELADGTVLQIEERRTSTGGWVGVRVDITELHRARQRAEASSQAKSAFLANVSHELRTPMNGILGMAELLSRTALAPPQAEMLQVIRDAGDALLVILNDILDLARIEAGKMRLSAHPFVPADEARKWEALHRVSARAKGIELILRTDARMTLTRFGDAARIGQIANNLIGNAVKFTPAGSVTVDLAEEADGRLRLAVSDTGIGMTADQLARVFEPFEQADNSVTRSFPGAGLGLSIVRKLTDLIGGTIDSTSTPGAGTSICVRLDVPRHVAPPSQAPAAPAPQRSFQGLDVLIADDNATNLLILDRMLRSLGAQVVSAGNGREALDAVLSRRFDVLFLDISMPVMDGLEALDRIRREGRATGRCMPPVVAATAHALQGDRDRYLAAGFAEVLTKPFRLSRITEILDRVLQPQPGPGPLVAVDGNRPQGGRSG